MPDGGAPAPTSESQSAIPSSTSHSACAAVDSRRSSRISKPMRRSITGCSSGLQQAFESAHAQAADEAARYRLAQEVKRLTLPDQMGERFQAMLFARGLDLLPLPAELLAADQGGRL